MAEPNIPVLPTITVNSGVDPAPFDPVGNPLHQLASYSYGWSLWWVNEAEFTTLAKTQDVKKAQAWDFGPKSYVVACDSGLYPDRRLPNTLGLNYHIQAVKINSTLKSAGLQGGNANSGTMKIVEPYGATFVDQLVAASWDGRQFKNYVMQPYVLQLEFFGYDDAGNPVDLSLYRKRFPIIISKMKISVSQMGTEYNITWVGFNHQVWNKENGYLASPIDIPNVKNVGEFFTQYSAKYNEYQANLAARSSQQYPDIIRFDIHDDIKMSNIINENAISLPESATNAKGITVSATGFRIPEGTRLLSVITKIMASSEFLQKQLGSVTDPEAKGLAQTSIFRAFKVTTAIELVPIMDLSRNQWPKIIVIMIRPYPTWLGGHPALPLLSNSAPWTVKEYQYLYTGKNTDIVDLRLTFDTTYYVTAMAFTEAYPAEQANKGTAINSVRNLLPKYILNPALFSAAIPQLTGIANFTPLRIKPVRRDDNESLGFNTTSSPESANMMNAISKGIFGNPGGGMLTMDLTIVGDPTFLKQDDWYYSPNPKTDTNYNSVDVITQADFVAQFGHIRTDAHDVVVRVVVKSPIDIDTDINNQGGVYPPGNTQTALFSGQYYVTVIESTFERGVFLQKLKLVRYMSSDYGAVPAETTNGRGGLPTINSAPSRFDKNGLPNAVDTAYGAIPVVPPDATRINPP